MIVPLMVGIAVGAIVEFGVKRIARALDLPDNSAALGTMRKMGYGAGLVAFLGGMAS